MACDVCGCETSKCKWVGPAAAAIRQCEDEKECDARAEAYWDAQ